MLENLITTTVNWQNCGDCCESW